MAGGQKRRFLSDLPSTWGRLDGKTISERIIAETPARGEIDRLHRDPSDLNGCYPTTLSVSGISDEYRALRRGVSDELEQQRRFFDNTKPHS